MSGLAAVAEAKSKFSKAQTKEILGHKREVHTLAWNSTGKKLASGSVDQIVRIWTIGHSSKDLVELKGHTGSVHQLCWDPIHPETLATASADKTVKIWDIRSGKCTRTIKTNGANINIAWSPDGSSIAVGNKLDVLNLIDAKTFKIIKTMKFQFEVQSPDSFLWSDHFSRLTK